MVMDHPVQQEPTKYQHLKHNDHINAITKMVSTSIAGSIIAVFAFGYAYYEWRTKMMKGGVESEG
jgi:hypothetical protein